IGKKGQAIGPSLLVGIPLFSWVDRYGLFWGAPVRLMQWVGGFMTRPVVGICSRGSPLEETPGPRPVGPRSRPSASRGAGVGTGAARLLGGPQPRRRGWSGRWAAEATRASPRSSSTLGAALGPLAGATGGARPPALW